MTLVKEEVKWQALHTSVRHQQKSKNSRNIKRENRNVTIPVSHNHENKYYFLAKKSFTFSDSTTASLNV
jgi:hypothetical protein